MNQWRFELWNEPDLHTYNIQNYTLESKFKNKLNFLLHLDARCRKTRCYSIYKKTTNLYQSKKKSESVFSIKERIRPYNSVYIYIYTDIKVSFHLACRCGEF